MNNKGFILTSLLFLITIISFMLLKMHDNTNFTIQNLQNFKFNFLNLDTSIFVKSSISPKKICHKSICLLKYNKFKNYESFFSLKAKRCDNLTLNNRNKTFFEAEKDCNIDFLYLDEDTYYSNNLNISKITLKKRANSVTLVSNGRVYIKELKLNSNLNVLATGEILIEKLVSNSLNLKLSVKSINSKIKINRLVGKSIMLDCSKHKGNYFSQDIICNNSVKFIKNIPNIVSAKFT